MVYLNKKKMMKISSLLKKKWFKINIFTEKTVLFDFASQFKKIINTTALDICNQKWDANSNKTTYQFSLWKIYLSPFLSSNVGRY